MIDFFYTTCNPCRDLVPGVVENYSRYGCNQHDVFFMEVTPRDTDEECHVWEEEYGIQYPTVGRDGESRTITNGYEISVYPTMILIAPNRQIIKQDIYPSTAIPAAFALAGIREFECTSGIKEECTSMNGTISIYPNPAENQLNVDYSGALNQNVFLEIYDVTGSLLIRQNANERNEINISHLASGFYLVKFGDEVKRFVKR